MKYTRKKMSRIIDELVTFLFSIGANDIKMDLKRTEDGYVLTISSDYDIKLKGKIQNLHEFLNADKNQGLDQYFWELAGVANLYGDSELHLVGQMIDKAEITSDDSLIQIKVWKNNE